MEDQSIVKVALRDYARLSEYFSSLSTQRSSTGKKIKKKLEVKLEFWNIIHCHVI